MQDLNSNLSSCDDKNDIETLNSLETCLDMNNDYEINIGSIKGAKVEFAPTKMTHICIIHGEIAQM